MIRALAWVYLKAPLRLVKLLPDRINHADEGRFNDALEASYNASVRRQYRRIKRRQRRGQ